MSFEIATIAFNNPETISWQIKLLRQNLQEHYSLIVADNSTNQSARREIEKICRQHTTKYLAVHPPLTSLNGSKSHAWALNWVFSNFFTYSTAQFVGFIDHDIYPYKKTKLSRYFDGNDIAGLVQEREDRWYLWPGFCFFEKDFLLGKNIDFNPWQNLDTGGANWISIYSRYNRDRLVKIRQSYFAVGVKLQKIHPSARSKIDRLLLEGSVVELLDDWVHIFNGSNWRKISSNHRDIGLIVDLAKEHYE